MIKLYIKCFSETYNCSKNAAHFFKDMENITEYYLLAFCKKCYYERKLVIENLKFIKLTKQEFLKEQKTQILR